MISPSWADVMILLMKKQFQFVYTLVVFMDIQLGMLRNSKEFVLLSIQIWIP